MRRVLATTVLGFAVLLPACGASGKTYHFTRVEIDATVNPDGSLSIVEDRTFDFRGDFSFAYFTIDATHAPPQNIVGFTVTENGEPREVVEGIEAGGYKATWYYTAHDEVKTFHISYRVLCAADVYEDAGHLNWQFIGTGWTEPTDTARITVHLPETAARVKERPASCPAVQDLPPVRATRPLHKGETRAWGHGPLSGNVRIIDPQTVELTVEDLPPATFVEGSILFPPGVVPQMAAIPGGQGRQRILDQEAFDAAEANELRARHARESTLVKILFGALPALFLALVLISRRRDRVEGIPEMVQEPPENIHPAELATIWAAFRKGTGTKDAYRTQFLHLAGNGSLDITAIGLVTEPEDFQLRPKKRLVDKLDKQFMEFLFPDEQPVNLKDVDAKGQRKKKLRTWWNRLSTKTRPTVKEINRGKSRWEHTVVRVLGIGGAIYGYHRWTGIGAEDGLVGTSALWLIPIAVLGWWTAGFFIGPRPKSRKLRERLARWGAFRRFLTDFSALDEAPTMAVVIWEHYLVWAVALGVADQVEKQVRPLVPEERLPSPWPGAPRGVPSYLWLHHATSQRVYTPASVAARTTSSSWSGGFGSSSSGGGFGGGFSGGGGGGGGGTGGGAG